MIKKFLVEIFWLKDFMMMDVVFLFFEIYLDYDGVLCILCDVLVGVDDGELFFECLCVEMLVFDDGQLCIVSYDVNQGFGLCVVCGEVMGYVYFIEIDEIVLCKVV